MNIKILKIILITIIVITAVIEGLYLDREWVEAIAPTACEQFFTRLENGYYLELADLIKS